MTINDLSVAAAARNMWGTKTFSALIVNHGSSRFQARHQAMGAAGRKSRRAAGAKRPEGWWRACRSQRGRSRCSWSWSMDRPLRRRQQRGRWSQQRLKRPFAWLTPTGDPRPARGPCGRLRVVCCRGRAAATRRATGNGPVSDRSACCHARAQPHSQQGHEKCPARSAVVGLALAHGADRGARSQRDAGCALCSACSERGAGIVPVHGDHAGGFCSPRDRS